MSVRVSSLRGKSQIQRTSSLTMLTLIWRAEYVLFPNFLESTSRQNRKCSVTLEKSEMNQK